MNIKSIHDCFGCGVCAISCGRNLIDIRLNKDGFYEPYIAESDKCTDCGLCVEVCSYSHDDYALNNVSMTSYAAWSKDPAVRNKCSSGGVGFEVGRCMIDQGYQVLGCRYNVGSHRAEHYVASTVEELIPSIGSKYIQSYTLEGFKQIEQKEKYLVIGTPCQIDSIRRYIQKFKCEDNFVLMDFFCHGVPSMLMWNKYIDWAEKQVGKITYVSWRNKLTGWHDSWAMSIIGDKQGNYVNLNSRLSDGDMFYKLFLSNSCLNKACYDKCRFKWDKSSADIRIGDAWGSIFKDNEEGINAAIAFTFIGLTILQNCNCQLKELPFDIVADKQMKSCATKTRLNKRIMNALHDESNEITDIYKLINKYKKQEKWKKRLKKPITAICNLLKQTHTR